MKKSKDYTLVALAIPLFFALLGSGAFSCNKEKQQKRIIKEVHDHGFTSVEYVQGKDTFGLDYVTPEEYRSEFFFP